MVVLCLPSFVSSFLWTMCNYRWERIYVNSFNEVGIHVETQVAVRYAKTTVCKMEYIFAVKHSETLIGNFFACT